MLLIRERLNVIKNAVSKRLGQTPGSYFGLKAGNELNLSNNIFKEQSIFIIRSR